MLNTNLSWSIFRDGKQDNRPVRFDSDWKTLTELLSVPIPVQTHLADPKGSTPAFSGAVFHEGQTRSISNMKSNQLLVLDFDNKAQDGASPSGQEVAERLDAGGIAGVIYTTYSSTPEKERFRVVVPMDRPLVSYHWREDWMRVSEWALDRLGLTPYREREGCIDLGALHNPAGMNFLPSSPLPDQMRFWIVDGGPLILDRDEILAYQLPAQISQGRSFSGNGILDFTWTEPFGIDFTTLRLKKLLEDHSIRTSNPSEIEGGVKYRCQCPWGEEHSQVKNGQDAYITLRQGKFPTFHCSHACHCDSRTIRDIAEYFGSEVLRGYAQPSRFTPGPLLRADELI